MDAAVLITAFSELMNLGIAGPMKFCNYTNNTFKCYVGGLGLISFVQKLVVTAALYKLLSQTLSVGFCLRGFKAMNLHINKYH